MDVCISKMNKFSIIIPTLDEEVFFTQQRLFFQSLLEQGQEIIVVDGGSIDNTITIAKSIGCCCISTKPSRGYQLQAGAKKSVNDILIFLHADTQLSFTTFDDINASFINIGRNWGRFNVAFNNEKFIFKVIAGFMNKRSCITGIVTGDQTMFVKRKTYFDCGGYKDIPIMEDIDISKRLRKDSRPLCLINTVITSSRKWEQQGIIKTIYLMWRLRILYFFGISADKLAKEYYS